MSSLFQQHNIRTRLVIYYTTFALLTLLAVIYFSYQQAVKSLQANMEDKLGVIAELQMNDLDRWLDEQQRYAIFLASLPELRSYSGTLLDDHVSDAGRMLAHSELTDLLSIIVQRTTDFQDIQIIDLNGDIVVSAILDNNGISQADQPYFTEGKSRTFAQPFYESQLLGGTTLTVATPLFDNSQKRVGVLALHFNMKRVDDIFDNGRGMNETVESYLVGPTRKFITGDPIILAQSQVPESPGILAALDGQEGSAFYTNHNGVPVMGRYFRMPEYNSALVVEMDEESALLPARELAFNIAITGLILSVLLIIVVILMAQRITAPLRSLSETVSRVSERKTHVPTAVTSEDEVDTLARAFNSMTDELNETLEGLQEELRERKQAQAELLQFRKVMDESSDALYLVDPETGRYIDFNKSAYERLGYSREELSQMSVIEVAEHLQNLQHWRKRVSLVRKSGELIFESVYRRKDGTSFPVEVSARMLAYGQGEVLVASVRDITERKLSEVALRESEERFRKVFQSSPVAICITTLEEGRLLDANYAYWDLTGYKPDESLGRDANELKMWDVPQERVAFIKDLKLRKSHFNPDDYFYHTNGSAKQVISFYELIRIGNQDCILAMFYDMSTQKQTMQALQQSEARIRALLSAFPDMVMEVAPDGRIVHMVPPKDTGTLMTQERFVEKHVKDVFPESAVSQTLFAIQRVVETEQMNVYEFESGMGGILRVMEARLVASASSTVLMLVRDITQRKWIESEREKLINELEAGNRESETLRESLASIVGTFEFTEIIQRILEQIKRVIPYDTASVWTIEEGQQVIISGVNLPPEIEVPGTTFPVDDGNSAYPILMGQVPYILNNNVQEELPDFQMEPHTYVNSWLAIPLKTRGKIIGLIALDGKSQDQFDEHHSELAVAFANQVAIALDNARLFSELQNELEKRRNLIAELEIKNAESETLRESVAIVAATLEKSEAIDRILEQLERVVPFDSASVQLINGNTLEMVSSRGFDLSLVPAENCFDLNENEPAYPVIQGSVPYALYDEVQDAFPAFRVFPHNRIHAWMAVPLKVKGEVLGIIALDGYQPAKFSERHAQLAVAYANQVAIALENARLFSDLQTELGIRKNLIVELENKNAELERFTYTVSHDLKSPLFTIRGFLGYLEQDTLSGNHERLTVDIQRITDATDKMHRLLNELLELSRIGRIKNESTVVPFGEIAHEAAELVAGHILERGVSVQIDDGMPAVYGDRPRLVEVMQNLLDNASKFMGVQRKPLIHVGQQGTDMESGGSVFFVRDNGIGIAPEHFERVFGLFNKLDPKSDGTGIGLALVKRIIEVHGGRIWVESEIGKGTTFFFTLPTQPQLDSVI
ncbi:MAG TPA: PAS domain S-box protein [Anaerolineales bacterium]|nr:PAS domain S-box protein [Anaerolineales bacterium]